MTLEFLMKHITDAVKMHLDYLEIDAIDGGSILPHEISDDEVTYHLVIKRKKQDVVEKNKSLETPSAPNKISGWTSNTTQKLCPRCKSTKDGCEFFDDGICRGIVYLTYPPQYDPCVF